MTLSLPSWTPRLASGTRILVTGATGGLGRALVGMIAADSDAACIGAHGGSQTFESETDDPRIVPIVALLDGAESCERVVGEFVERAGGIEALCVLSGGIHYSGHWKSMPEADWNHDIDLNLNVPFYLARAAMAAMTRQGTGGSILLTGTESALHGGSPSSFPYAVAKRGTEAMVQGLAREGAPAGVLVNGVRLGYIASGFHQRWHGRTAEDMAERAELVPLKRGGDPREAAALMVYLMSGWARFITGQMIPLTGGDWL
jgi:3-oxoacyl-[acyl-carrier protein] reductase